MEELSLATPSILFSAISLIMLAYTNRFLSYAQVIRSISADALKNNSPELISQIDNLRRRLNLTRNMQLLGILSLLLCVVSTFFIYIGWQLCAVYAFAAALISLIVSLSISIQELLISVKALDIHLGGIKK